MTTTTTNINILPSEGTTTNQQSPQKAPRTIVVATRLHLGNASTPPSKEKIQGWIRNLQSMISSSPSVHNNTVTQGLIAVDATPNNKILVDGGGVYDFVQAIRDQVEALDCQSTIVVLPVTPWGQFVPALNALVNYTHNHLHADQILFLSAEVNVSAASIQVLSDHCCMDDKDENPDSYVLVAGAALNGHVYKGSADKPSNTVLDGRTCPWNTFAMWNLPKLVLTGFVLVSDSGSNGGVEECAAIAVHQQLFPKARAKLVKLADVEWQDSFDDEARREWHERKMNSKLERAAAQLQLLGLGGKGVVEHC